MWISVKHILTKKISRFNLLNINWLDATTKKRLKNNAQRLLLIQKKVVILAEHNETVLWFTKLFETKIGEEVNTIAQD
jgi:hypothetical protein